MPKPSPELESVEPMCPPRADLWSRRDMLKLMGVGAAGLAIPAAGCSRAHEATMAQAAPRPDARNGGPNIVFVLADDLGYGDLGCYGCEDIQTPHIDELAKDGVRCTHAYMASPICGPSRAGLLTGRYPNRFGFELNWTNVLPPYQPSVAQMLKDAGYATGCIGKWHLGHTADTHPIVRGFDEFFGNIGGKSNFLPTERQPDVEVWRGSQALYDRNTGLMFRDQYMRGCVEAECEGYLTDVLNREACDFIDRHHEQPFFLFLSHHAPHAPLQATAEYMDRYRRDQFKAWGDQAEARHTYAAMVSSVDDSVAMVRRRLAAHGIDRNTLIIFASDNGGTRTGRNAPLRDGKKSVYEGGIRVPMIATQPGQLATGRICKTPVTALDLYPTFTGLAGGKAHWEYPSDGRDILPIWRDPTRRTADRDMFWRCGTQRAIRRGRWKLVQSDDRKAELYDVVADPGELNDLSAQHADVLATLDKAYDHWELAMAPPAWGRPRDLKAFDAWYRKRWLPR